MKCDGARSTPLLAYMHIDIGLLFGTANRILANEIGRQKVPRAQELAAVLSTL